MRFPLSPVLCTALAVALAGCTPSPSAPAERAASEEARASQGADTGANASSQAGQGSVTIAGEDAAEDVQQWTPPRVDRQGRSLALFPYVLPFQILPGMETARVIHYCIAAVCETAAACAAEFIYLKVRRLFA